MTILITGASSGIGQSTAYEFAKNKANLILTYNKNQTGIEETKEKCLHLGTQSIKIYKLDLADTQSILEFSQNTKGELPQIDWLINNAAVKHSKLLKEKDFAEIEHELRTNLEGTIKLTQQLLPIIKKGIINVASSLALNYAKKYLTIYCASKYGLRGFTKSLAREYPELKTYTLNPSLTATQMGHFKGMEPNFVAKIIFNTVINKYNLKPGSDINPRDYRFGKNLKPFLIIVRFIKKIITRRPVRRSLGGGG